MNNQAGQIGRTGLPGGQEEANGWTRAVRLTERWLVRGERTDSLLEQLTPDVPAQERARAQHLFYGVVRWFSRLEAAMAGLIAHRPRTKVRAILFVTGFELSEGGPEAAARVVHHAVERAKSVASPSEARLVNAVARKMADRLAEKPAGPAAEFAHPDWLVERWAAQFGPEATRRLLAWNQTPAPVYARWRRRASAPEFLAATRWPGFHGIKPGHWDEVRRLAAEGALYLQDPSTRICVDLLAPRAHEVILDACAAPGGKSLLIADAMASEAGATEKVAGRLVALDEPGPRLERLNANLQHAPPSVPIAIVPGRLDPAGPGRLGAPGLPAAYDAVLVDAPCTNTGVMRHRVDVKWRLREGDFARHAAQQFALLRAAATLVRDGGRLVYSTCSLDPEENDGVVERFLRADAGWALDRQRVAHPWADDHDGAAAFALIRRARR